MSTTFGLCYALSISAINAVGKALEPQLTCLCNTKLLR